MDYLWMVPFKTDVPEEEESVEIAPGDLRLGDNNITLGSVGIAKRDLVENNNSHLFGSAFVPTGTNHVLTYGKAPDARESVDITAKHKYGVLIPSGVDNPSGSDDISFCLEPILGEGEAGKLSEALSTADGLLEKLNDVMFLMGSSHYASILNIFDVVKRENKILACSYPTFDHLRNEIQSALIRIPFESMELIEEISRISEKLSTFSNTLSDAGSGFPTNYGIPEGSFGFWWNGNEFLRLINGVNISIVDPESYCYPPSLWYYANSAILTSYDENVRTEYVPANITWDDILDKYKGGGAVDALTQSVAITDPLQYGVALLDLCLDTPGEPAATLIKDCPLTGIIVGDQRDVDFRFVPGSASKRYYVYDNVINGVVMIGEADVHTQTLLLESAKNGEVHFALEFRNNTGYTRQCQQGEILPRCKFYVAGVLEAPSGSSKFSSVFSKDHRTSVKVKITSLESAYTTVPDLHSPQLEIGLVAEMKWSQITPQSLVLDY